MSKCIALILFGGKGNRFSSLEAKQFHKFNGVPLYQLTISKFESSPLIDEIDLVSYKEGISKLKEGCKRFSKLKAIYEGGSSRQESVKLALEGLKKDGAQDDDIVLIHDGDRPFVSERIIEENIEMVKQKGAALTATASTDTTLLVKEGKIVSYLRREEVYQAQTPQSFRFSLIYEAHQKEKEAVTDDASLLIRQGKEVGIVSGEKANFKITNPEDEDLAILRLRK